MPSCSRLLCMSAEAGPQGRPTEKTKLIPLKYSVGGRLCGHPGQVGPGANEARNATGSKNDNTEAIQGRALRRQGSLEKTMMPAKMEGSRTRGDQI